MDPQIIDRESFVVAGSLTRITRGSETPELFAKIWQQFESFHHRLKPYTVNHAYYGISFPTDSAQVTDYLAGMAVDQAAPIPEGLTTRNIPAAQHAVFECPVQAIGETYQHIFNRWLPQSGYRLDDLAPVFEWYPREGSATQSVRIHVPILMVDDQSQGRC